MTKQTPLIFRNSEWVWKALIKQFEAETGLTVASIGDVTGHILGKEYETEEYRTNSYNQEFKGVEIEIEEWKCSK